jgi:hypothetical protein
MRRTNDKIPRQEKRSGKLRKYPDDDTRKKRPEKKRKQYPILGFGFLNIGKENQPIDQE